MADALDGAFRMLGAKVVADSSPLRLLPHLHRAAATAPREPAAGRGGKKATVAKKSRGTAAVVAAAATEPASEAAELLKHSSTVGAEWQRLLAAFATQLPELIRREVSEERSKNSVGERFRRERSFALSAIAAERKPQHEPPCPPRRALTVHHLHRAPFARCQIVDVMVQNSATSAATPGADHWIFQAAHQEQLRKEAEVAQHGDREARKLARLREKSVAEEGGSAGAKVRRRQVSCVVCLLLPLLLGCESLHALCATFVDLRMNFAQLLIARSSLPLFCSFRLALLLHALLPHRKQPQPAQTASARTRPTTTRTWFSRRAASRLAAR